MLDGWRQSFLVIHKEELSYKPLLDSFHALRSLIWEMAYLKLANLETLSFSYDLPGCSSKQKLRVKLETGQKLVE